MKIIDERETQKNPQNKQIKKKTEKEQGGQKLY